MSTNIDDAVDEAELKHIKPCDPYTEPGPYTGFCSTRMEDKYKFSVIDVCADIHGDSCGSGEGLPDYVLEEYVDWLERRTADLLGWDANRCPYDACVYVLAKAALQEGKISLQESKGYWAKKKDQEEFDKSG